MRWIIKKLAQNPFDEKNPTDPKALYSYTMSQKGSTWCEGSGLLYEEIQWLLKYFNKNKVEELAGVEFEAPRDSGSLALGYISVVQKNGGNYNPPSAEVILETAARAMSKLELPDFSLIDKETIWMAFQGVWDGFNAKSEWLTEFAEKIKEYSGNTVELQKAEIKEFSAQIKGPAEYLKLVSGEKRIKVIIGPYSSPIEFDK